MRHQFGSIRKFALPGVMLIAFSSTAFAHPGHYGNEPVGFAQGLVHPWGGLDHMLAMVTVGLWAALRRGKMLWGLPLTFMSGMLIGSILGIAGMPMIGVDAGIALSVIVLGTAVAAGASRVPIGIAIGLVAASGFLHGFAHGSEMIKDANAAMFMTGMLLSTAVLHTLGVGVMTLAVRRNWSLAAARVTSGAFAVCGLLMLVGFLSPDLF